VVAKKNYRRATYKKKGPDHGQEDAMGNDAGGNDRNPNILKSGKNRREKHHPSASQTRQSKTINLEIKKKKKTRKTTTTSSSVREGKI